VGSSGQHLGLERPRRAQVPKKVGRCCSLDGSTRAGRFPRRKVPPRQMPRRRGRSASGWHSIFASAIAEIGFGGADDSHRAAEHNRVRRRRFGCRSQRDVRESAAAVHEDANSVLCRRRSGRGMNVRRPAEIVIWTLRKNAGVDAERRRWHPLDKTSGNRALFANLKPNRAGVHAASMGGEIEQKHKKDQDEAKVPTASGSPSDLLVSSAIGCVITRVRHRCWPPTISPRRLPRGAAESATSRSRARNRVSHKSVIGNRAFRAERGQLLAIFRPRVLDDLSR